MAEENEETTGETPEESAPESDEETPAAEAEAEMPAAEPEVAEEEPAAEAEEEAPAPEALEQPQAKPKRKRLPRSQRRQRPKPVRQKPKQRRPIMRLPKPETERGARQERRGVVVSNAMDKTIVVRVETQKAHARYQKIIRRSTKFHAHDERNEANVGDLVRIAETRPVSRTKRWRLVEIIEVAK
jgi:small subunit ribosomal protein S17